MGMNFDRTPLVDFVGRFNEDTKIEVDGNALLDIYNAFSSGQSHRVMELFVLRNHDNSPVRKLYDALAVHAKGNEERNGDGQGG